MTAERRYAIQGRKDSEAARVAFAVTHMSKNKAYRYAVARTGGDPDGAILNDFIGRFRSYRTGWRGNPRHAIEHGLSDSYYAATGNPPLSVDIETAAVCDLACPFCYRQWIVTPDKLISDELYYRLVDQCAELGVPSLKLNWRGEPLLHPRLPEYIDYAKRAGILETIINTDAVTLTEAKSRALIEAGLDLLIYSFDGGTKETYEKMRVGRFAENRFDDVYENIRRFARIRDEMESPWPVTKIQMILTAETYPEQDSFFELFSDCVDDVSVKAYTERGGALHTLDPATEARVVKFLGAKGIPVEDVANWRDLHGGVFVAVGRLPCEQPYQRLMVTYDGTVSMCCYDWGSEYPIGYVDSRAFTEADEDYEAVRTKIESGAKGFTPMANAQMPTRYIEPPQQVQTLKEVWDGAIVNEVRRVHAEGRVDDVPVCRTCPFKETYAWEQVPDDG